MSTNELEPISGELVRTHGRTLFQTDDPVEVLDHARRMADALKTALDEGGMTMRIGRSEHVTITGWQTLGSMLGVSPHVVWSRRIDSDSPDAPYGWEARAEARTVDGRVVGSAEAMVTRAERNWRGAEDYALRSMAQTRAQSKALRGPLGFVIALAGKDATPAEEMAADGPTTPQAGLPGWAADIDGDAVDRFGGNLARSLAYIDGDPERAALDVANKIAAYCDGTVPAACARLAKLLADVANPSPAPGVPDPDWGEPHAAAPDVPPEEGQA